MIRAAPEDLDRMRDVGVPGGGGDALGPRLNLRPGRRHAAAADPAHHVMVVAVAVGVAGRAAQPVLRLAVVANDHIDDMLLGQRVQVAIHRGQTDPLTTPLQCRIDLLRRAETVRLLQRAHDCVGLTRPSHARGPTDDARRV